MRYTLPPPACCDWSFFLDVDGTLLDFAETPDAVHVDEDLVQLMAKLYQCNDGAVALVSGRSISGLDALIADRIAPLHLPIAGQHGLERRDSTGRLWMHAISPAIKARLVAALKQQENRYPELVLEDKGLTLALHYRRKPALAAYIQRVMRQLLAETEGFELQKGKYLVEIKPAGFDKGSAISEYMTESQFAKRTPVFIGDDHCDEHGFAVINALGGFSIKVGKGRSCAHYRLPDVAAVRNWLEGAVRRSSSSHRL